MRLAPRSTERCPSVDTPARADRCAHVATAADLHEMVDEALELAQVAALEHAVAVGGVLADDRVAGVPVARGSGFSQ